MDWSHLSQAELIVVSKQALANALRDEVILGYLSEWGYNAARLQAGQQVLSRVTSLSNTGSDLGGDQLNATFDKNQAWQEAEREYMKQLTVARVAVKRPGDRSKLCLDGDREQSYAGWWQQTSKFYEQALENPEILAQLAEFNLTPAKLQAGQALLNQLDAAQTEQISQKGNKQNTAAERAAALKELQQWMSDFEAIAEVALEDHPQLLEALGFVVPSNLGDGPEVEAPAAPLEVPGDVTP
jgi:hypothetical protein